MEKDPEMRKLAQDIIKAQKGEIEQMNKWLLNRHGFNRHLRVI
jgi:uncharacterized protein (DUF305 family)